MDTTNFPEFHTWLTEQDRAEKTVNGYLADLERFATWFEHANDAGLTPLRLTPVFCKIKQGHPG